DLALVEEDAVHDPLDRLIEGRVLEHDVRGLAPELERQALTGPGHAPPHDLPDLGRPGERDLRDVRAPGPGITFTTPGGSSACSMTSASRNAVSGVVEAGFSTAVLPVASAGASFHAHISRGKFHGVICAATPSGRGVRPGKAYSILSAQPA